MFFSSLPSPEGEREEKKETKEERKNGENIKSRFPVGRQVRREGETGSSQYLEHFRKESGADFFTVEIIETVEVGDGVT